jgi:hypothetical protein
MPPLNIRSRVRGWLHRSTFPLQYTRNSLCPLLTDSSMEPKKRHLLQQCPPNSLFLSVAPTSLNFHLLDEPSGRTRFLCSSPVMVNTRHRPLGLTGPPRSRGRKSMSPSPSAGSAPGSVAPFSSNASIEALASPLTFAVRSGRLLRYDQHQDTPASDQHRLGRPGKGDTSLIPKAIFEWPWGGALCTWP